MNQCATNPGIVAGAAHPRTTRPPTTGTCTGIIITTTWSALTTMGMGDSTRRRTESTTPTGVRSSVGPSLSAVISSKQTGELPQGALLTLASLLVSALVLGACSARSGTVSSQQPGDGGSVHVTPAQSDASSPSGGQTAAPTSGPPTQTTSAPSAMWPAVPPSGQPPTDAGPVGQEAGLTPAQLVAMYCRKYPACARLTCAPTDMPVQLAVCPPDNVPVCECILRSVGQ